MPNLDLHTFHIPVMGTSFSIDTPIKVAKFGIDSVIQIMDDFLCEKMREHYAGLYQLPYQAVHQSEPDYRARRITAYLDLLDMIVKNQIQEIRSLPFEASNDLTKYFELLPNTSPLKEVYQKMLLTSDLIQKTELQTYLKSHVQPGSIDVNIMTVVDRDNYDSDGQLLPDEYSDALSALRGFAKSTVSAGVVFSAGFNRRLNSYIEQFSDFFPDQFGKLKKKVILKVSDFRSSLIQGKLLAKKGIWVSEFRIESGLNCGGHVFPSEGYLLGPILEEFKGNRTTLNSMLFDLCNESLAKKGKPLFFQQPSLRITVQGGIGTAKENQFLFRHYQVDGTGWATPFLLVPEATTVDDETRQLLAKATTEDVYVSPLSPLGVPFNMVKNTMSAIKRRERIQKGKPGNACRKGHLCFNNEFGKMLCTASSAYQKKKIELLNQQKLSSEDYQKQYQVIVEKSCLCEELGAGAYISHKIPHNGPLHPIICPGPNIAYFSKIVSLADMIGHIYGRLNLITFDYRPHMFITELKMYLDYLKGEILNALPKLTDKHIKHFNAFKQNLLLGIDYYKMLIPKLVEETHQYQDMMMTQLMDLKSELDQLIHQHQHTIFVAQLT